MEIPARDAGTIVDAVSFLRGVESGERPMIGRRVAVYGPRGAQMPAHEDKAQDAEREGVRIIKTFEGPELKAPDHSGSPQPTGRFETLAADTVTVGVGHGKWSAREIDAWLHGAEADRPPKHALAAIEMLVHAHA